MKLERICVLLLAVGLGCSPNPFTESETQPPPPTEQATPAEAEVSAPVAEPETPPPAPLLTEQGTPAEATAPEPVAEPETPPLPTGQAAPVEAKVPQPPDAAALGMKFKLIPAGEFMMGSPRDDPIIEDDESPQHLVRITRPFYLGVHEVTQEQYQKVMGENPSRFKGPALPAETVSWNDATSFCSKLSEMDPDFDYRLPTEAEWEYACRAGTTTRYSCGDALDPQYAWFDDNSDEKTHPVGQTLPNAWGLYDMYGNVWEWCEDRYGSYARLPSADPTGPTSGSFRRVFRGGGWYDRPGYCRSANRDSDFGDHRGYNLGFRVAQVRSEKADERPDFSLEGVPDERGLEKPALFLVRYFQVEEACYMKPPLAEQLLEPDGKPALTARGVVAREACTCNSACTCVPVSTCACNTVCTCNTVNSAHGVSSASSDSDLSSSTPSRGGGGGYGGYFAPCF